MNGAALQRRLAQIEEQLAALVPAPSGREEALAWARKVPLREGSIEIRPVMDLAPFGYQSRTLMPAHA